MMMEMESFLRKPQGKEELEPPEAAKEKQVSNLGLITPQFGFLCSGMMKV